MSHYLVSHRVISLADNEEITKPTTSSKRAAEILLSRVYSSLQNGDIVAFHKLLHVMQQHGTSAMMSLCNEIKAQIDGTDDMVRGVLQGRTCSSCSKLIKTFLMKFFIHNGAKCTMPFMVLNKIPVVQYAIIWAKLEVAISLSSHKSKNLLELYHPVRHFVYGFWEKEV